MTAVAPMTGQNIYDMVTALNGQQAIDQTLFLQLLSLEQSKVEASREWVLLRKQDTSQSRAVADTYKTSKNLPSDFFFFQTEKAIVMLDPKNTNNWEDYWLEVPFAQMITYQNQSYRYALDLVNNKIYFSGNSSTAFTIVMNYIYKPTTVTAATLATWTWDFPAQFHSYLAYAVIARFKGGVDFDEINKPMATENELVCQTIRESMIDWDERLQTAGLRGIDRGNLTDTTFYSGRVPMGDDLRGY